MFTHHDLHVITNPASTPADFETARQARIDADIEAAMRAHPSYRCDDPGCGRTSLDGCGKCSRAVQPKLRIVREGDVR